MPRQDSNDNIPPEPVGNDEAATWLRWVHRMLSKRLNFISTPQIRFEYRTDGIHPIINLPNAGSRAATKRFPFHIYNSPPAPDIIGTPEEIAAEHADKDWRTFRVRNGLVGLSSVDFTDGVTNPDETEVPAFDTDIDFVLDDGEAHNFVWIDADGPPLEIHMSTSIVPVPVGGWSETTGWDDGKYILLGWIDTATDSATKRAHIRQLVRADLPEYLQAQACIDDVEVTVRMPARIVD